MRYQLVCILISFYSFALLHGQNGSTLLTLNQVHTQIADSLDANQTALDWADMDIDLLWSTLVRTDSFAIVGFKPSSIPSNRDAINSGNFTSVEWKTARKNLIAWITTESIRLGFDPLSQDLFGQSNNETRPYLHVKLFSKDIINALRNNPDIRYVEPANYEFNGGVNRSGEGCSDYSVVLDPIDYSIISPASISSWIQAEHNIDQAWNSSNKGNGVWIAVMDSGVSANNPKFNGEFAEGESAGRIIEKKGFYAPNGIIDGTVDMCGHGTAMAGLAVGTRGFDSTPAGVSYQANLVSYRVTNDVIINASAEIDGLYDGLMDAGNDSRIQVISISLGDVFTHGPVEDGIIFAHDLGKLIFAAAGTSTSFTNFVGVIFPASMPEAVAVTGVIEGSNFQRCNNCHSGDEVEFCVFMERSASGNTAVTNTNDNAANNDYRGYVGGSSASTAIMSGIAGLIYSNNPTFSKDQVLNKLIDNGSNYPNKDGDYGWGTIDVLQAVDTAANVLCNNIGSNDISMEINSITFPAVDDGVGDPELVLKIGGKSYFFVVPNNGASSNPNTYIDDTVCDNVLINVDLGTVNCGVNSVNISLETHEDDGFLSECDFNFGDDFQTITTESIDLNASSFTQSTTNGDWVFHYTLIYSPTVVAQISSNLPACSGESLTFDASPSGETNYDFFLDSNGNGLLDTGESLQSGPSVSYTSAAFQQNDILGLEITDSNGCAYYTFVDIEFVNFAGENALTGIETGIADFETNDIIQSTQIIDATAIVDYDALQQICLEPGFEVIQGAVFSAFLDGCNGGLGGENVERNTSINK